MILGSLSGADRRRGARQLSRTEVAQRRHSRIPRRRAAAVAGRQHPIRRATQHERIFVAAIIGGPVGGASRAAAETGWVKSAINGAKKLLRLIQ